MYFIGIITDKNSENNIKSIMKNKLNDNRIIFLNRENIDNYKNVRFDSIVINNKVDDKYILNKMMEKSRYVLLNSDFEKDNRYINNCYNLISYGFNSRANVTISSVGDDECLLYIQGVASNDDMQEIKFKKGRTNVNVYDGMITTIINLLYNKWKKLEKVRNIKKYSKK